MDNKEFLGNENNNQMNNNTVVGEQTDPSTMNNSVSEQPVNIQDNNVTASMQEEQPSQTTPVSEPTTEATLNQPVNGDTNNVVDNQQTITNVNSNPDITDYSKVIDPSKITVGPEAINSQVPVEKANPEEVAKKEVVTQNTTPQKSNKFGLFLVFLLFAGVGAFIYFMPQIDEMLNRQNSNQQVSQEKQENDNTNKVVYDSIVCSKISSTYTIYSTDSKLKKYSISSNYTSAIDEHYNSCLQLQQSEVNGFVVSCGKDTNSVNESKTYDLTLLPETFERSDLKFGLDANIDEVKNSLVSDGYTCN